MFLNLGCGNDSRGDIRIDINPERKGLNIIADAHCIPLRDNVFDCVFCKSTLEHLKSPIKGLSEMKRVSNEKILIVVPNVHHWRRIRREFLKPNHDINMDTTHLQAWDGHVFKLLVNQIGDLAVESIGWGYFNGSMRWPSFFFGSNMIVKLRVET